jgi:hypothetical protein
VVCVRLVCPMCVCVRAHALVVSCEHITAPRTCAPIASHHTESNISEAPFYFFYASRGEATTPEKAHAYIHIHMHIYIYIWLLYLHAYICTFLLGLEQ